MRGGGKGGGGEHLGELVDQVFKDVARGVREEWLERLQVDALLDHAFHRSFRLVFG